MNSRGRLRRCPSAIALLAVLFAASSAGADHHENWVEIKSLHFTVYSNGTEGEGRLVATHFEQIRALFEESFPDLRVDAGDKPTILYALKNEDSLKLFLPGYSPSRGSVTICGQYMRGNDKNFAVVRTDSPCMATNPSVNNSTTLVRGMFMNQISGAAAHPFKPIYHEYAHGVFRLNFRSLPLWLDEGLAEYWGNSVISNKQARVGEADAVEIAVLKQGPFLPIDKLVSIDSSSPLYNTPNHIGIFYAESWALVHYLMMSPDVRDQNLLAKYLAALQATDDPIEAATKTFGDLNKLGEKVDAYCRQLSFYVAQVPLHLAVSDKELTARRLTPAEGLIHQADYLMHSRHLPEAIDLLHQAASLEPNVPGLHDALGYYHYVKNDFGNASKEFDLALEADPNDAAAYYLRAEILYHNSGYSVESTPQIQASLEKAVALRPRFAAAHAFLSVAYADSPGMGSKAIEEAQRAISLEPGNYAYFLDLGRALLADGKLDDAKKVADRAQKSAVWPQERSRADSFAREVNARLHSSAVQDSAASGAAAPAPRVITGVQVRVVRTVEGQITEPICGHPPEITFTLATSDGQIQLLVKDVAQIQIHNVQGDLAAGSSDCATWKDRKAKVIFTVTNGGAAAGEVKSILFE